VIYNETSPYHKGENFKIIIPKTDIPLVVTPWKAVQSRQYAFGSEFVLP
jgi:hypothetical protein